MVEPNGLIAAKHVTELLKKWFRCGMLGRPVCGWQFTTEVDPTGPASAAVSQDP